MQPDVFVFTRPIGTAGTTVSSWRVHCGDVRKFCARYDGPPLHACLTDPPYHLTSKRGDGKGFMGAAWDGGDIAFRAETWAALAKHLLPGAFGMTFAGSRGWHRVACAIEDAGLRLHPTIFCWVTGQGFPKAYNAGQAIQKKLTTGKARRPDRDLGGLPRDRWSGSEEGKLISDTGGKVALTEAVAKAFKGHAYGLQALKPAVEPIIVWQVPYEGKPVDSIVKHGAGALNIEAGRIGSERRYNAPAANAPGGASLQMSVTGMPRDAEGRECQGRWPANFALQHHPDCRRVGTKKVGQGEARVNQEEEVYDGVHDGYKRKNRSSLTHNTPGTTRQYGEETVEEWRCAESCPVRKLDEQSGHLHARGNKTRSRTIKTGMFGAGLPRVEVGDPKDAGGASRFFFNSDWNAEVEEGILSADPVRYQAKAAGHSSIDKLKLGGERHEGCESFFWLKGKRIDEETWMRLRAENIAHKEDKAWKPHPIAWGNIHPTQKPIKLCKWLASLLLPPDAYAPRRILVPFSGAGSEMCAAGLAGWDEIVGVEREAEYAEIARARLRHWLPDADEKEGEE